jgi:hypothetical protein
MVLHVPRLSLMSSGHGLPKVLPGPALLSSAGGPPLKWPYVRRVGGLRPSSIPWDTPRRTPMALGAGFGLRSSFGEKIELMRYDSKLFLESVAVLPGAGGQRQTGRLAGNGCRQSWNMDGGHQEGTWWDLGNATEALSENGHNKSILLLLGPDESILKKIFRRHFFRCALDWLGFVKAGGKCHCQADHVKKKDQLIVNENMKYPRVADMTPWRPTNYYPFSVSDHGFHLERCWCVKLTGSEGKPDS